MTFVHTISNLNQQLQDLVAEACSHPAKSLMRRQKLSEIVRVVMKSGKLWKENTAYYNDALQQTWLYFCRNPEQYNQESCTVLTWLNNCLKWRLQDFRSREAQIQAKTVPLSSLSIENITGAIESLPATDDIPPILQETYQWVFTDPDNDLASTHVKGRPEVTCQILILRRLPPETPWKNIAKEFDLPPSTAPNFYKRECLPRLRNFAIKQGYHEIGN
ncbi:DNA-directed RNA polymerase specialized sigma subunit, sigma24 family [Nostoc flagelliforme CCNUN1]|uniref:DNA-directed RNA polymerase specialized sigma subunit, sigma24 family n=1 Tax=Nostoc flagelliforme CCNUN1 TaxID=2038116 RepID=A0A2K8T2U8_9NOSO|nr:sigma-70 family RNA polymerase sigma factor [Nostoc flagelliforme]AUB42036.1 DNA-directed RNA polymerase specialized sigma subunit, sigma24 family [Nostoc flagelliforme CCNUN1]